MTYFSSRFLTHQVCSVSHQQPAPAPLDTHRCIWGSVCWFEVQADTCSYSLRLHLSLHTSLYLQRPINASQFETRNVKKMCLLILLITLRINSPPCSSQAFSDNFWDYLSQLSLVVPVCEAPFNHIIISDFPSSTHNCSYSTMSVISTQACLQSLNIHLTDLTFCSASLLGVCRIRICNKH